MRQIEAKAKAKHKKVLLYSLFLTLTSTCL